jgi:AcrR family transcriptional regulator
VLAAARELFSEVGFDRTTMRAVAARAGVDPALIHHYYGNKDGLLTATLMPPAAAAQLLTGAFVDPDNAGEELVRRVIDVWETHLEVREQMAAMLRTGLSHEHAAELLRDAHRTFILAAVGSAVAEDRRELRAALIGCHLAGLLLARYLLRVPGLTAATPAELVATVGPVIQHYLTGAISDGSGLAESDSDRPRSR